MSGLHVLPQRFRPCARVVVKRIGAGHRIRALHDLALHREKMVEVEAGTNHRVDISCAGYKPIRQFYRVEAGETRKVDILLQKGKSRSLFGF